MTVRGLIACAILAATSQVAYAQSAADSREYQLPLTPAPLLAPLPQAESPTRTRRMILEEIEVLSAERRQYSLALPIGLLIGGGVATLSGVSFLAVGLVVKGATFCDDDDRFGDGSCTSDDLATIYIVSGSIAAGVGVVLLIVGGSILGDRTGPRRELGERIKALRRELQWTVAGLPLSVEPLANGASLRLSF